VQERQGFPSDIFSLGCVFLEMQTAVVGPSYHGLLQSLIKRTWGEDFSYQGNADLVNEWIKQLEDHPQSLDGLQISPRETRSRMKTVRAMMSMEPSERPSAVDIAMMFGSNECCDLDREDFRDEAPTSSQPSGA
jgi:serine/threonine protein kinase